MVAYIGLTLGPPLGGLIATHLGWRWIFLLNAPVAAATLLAGWDLLGPSDGTEPPSACALE